MRVVVSRILELPVNDEESYLVEDSSIIVEEDLIKEINLFLNEMSFDTLMVKASMIRNYKIELELVDTGDDRVGRFEDKEIAESGKADWIQVYVRKVYIDKQASLTEVAEQLKEAVSLFGQLNYYSPGQETLPHRHLANITFIDIITKILKAKHAELINEEGKTQVVNEPVIKAINEAVELVIRRLKSKKSRHEGSVSIADLLAGIYSAQSDKLCVLERSIEISGEFRLMTTSLYDRIMKQLGELYEQIEKEKLDIETIKERLQKYA